MEYDGNVLQFYCLWIQKDDEVNMFTHVLLLYYLADDTIELRNDDVEKELSSQGRKRQHARDGVLKSKILVRRSKLPKKKVFQIYVPLPKI